MRILLAEDDAVLSDGITLALSQAGYDVDTVRSGEEADNALTAMTYDAVILDLGLPRLDGLDVLERTRNRGNLVPVLILTARDTLQDRVTGLDLGADDYLTKPFDLPELEARIRALIRRKYTATATTELQYGQVRFNVAAKRVFANDKPLDLSAKEIGTLEFLLLHSGQVVNKEQITDHVYGWDDEVSPNAIEVIIHRLRKKLERYGLEIKTIRGLGYLVEKNRDDISI